MFKRITGQSIGTPMFGGPASTFTAAEQRTNATAESSSLDLHSTRFPAEDPRAAAHARACIEAKELEAVIRDCIEVGDYDTAAVSALRFVKLAESIEAVRDREIESVVDAGYELRKLAKHIADAESPGMVTMTAQRLQQYLRDAAKGRAAKQPKPQPTPIEVAAPPSHDAGTHDAGEP